MRVLVTGAAGFIGSHIVEELVDTGHEVVALDVLLPAVHPEPDSARERVPTGVTLLEADVRDAAAVRGALAGIDVVCHQAAMVGLGVDMADAPLYAGCNDLGTAVVLAAMAETGVRRLVLASSMVVYGEGRYECRRHGVVSPGPRAAGVRGRRPAPRLHPRPRCGPGQPAGPVGGGWFGWRWRLG